MNVEVMTVVFIEEWGVGSGELGVAARARRVPRRYSETRQGVGSGERGAGGRDKRERSSTINCQLSEIDYFLKPKT